MTDLYRLRALEGRLKEKFPGIDVEVITSQVGSTLYAMPAKAIRGVRVFMAGDNYEMALVDVYERDDSIAKGNPSMNSPSEGSVIEFIEDLGMG